MKCQVCSFGRERKFRCGKQFGKCRQQGQEQVVAGLSQSVFAKVSKQLNRTSQCTYPDVEWSADATQQAVELSADDGHEPLENENAFFGWFQRLRVRSHDRNNLKWSRMRQWRASHGASRRPWQRFLFVARSVKYMFYFLRLALCLSCLAFWALFGDSVYRTYWLVNIFLNIF